MLIGAPFPWTGLIVWKSYKIFQERLRRPWPTSLRKVGLSQTPCWKRIQKLEATGVVQNRVAIVSPQKVGIGLSVHIAIQAGDHSAETLENFVSAVSAMPEVMEFSRLAGEVDYALRVVAPNISPPMTPSTSA